MLHYADLAGATLGQATFLHRGAPFACLRVRGPDGVSFLHRLCSQDVEGMADGDARPAAFLTAKGKLETLAWIGRAGGDLWVETQAHEVTKLAALLDRYHFSERLAVEVVAGAPCVQLVGPRTWEGGGSGRCQVEAGHVRMSGQSRGLTWVRLHGGERDTGAVPLDESSWQCLRIAAGLPWMGLDADAGTLAMEADIDDHICATKGCYTGQEIVARIQTYGHTNRRLCRLRIAGAGSAPGASIADPEGEPVGRITSAANVPGTEAAIAFGYLPRELASAGTRVVVRNATDHNPSDAVVC